jgi:hypothetical protein
MHSFLIRTISVGLSWYMYVAAYSVPLFVRLRWTLVFLLLVTASDNIRNNPFSRVWIALLLLHRGVHSAVTCLHTARIFWMIVQNRACRPNVPLLSVPPLRHQGK